MISLDFTKDELESLVLLLLRDIDSLEFEQKHWDDELVRFALQRQKDLLSKIHHCLYAFES